MYAASQENITRYLSPWIIGTILVGMVLLSVAVVLLLVWQRHRAQAEEDMRETLIYRFGQLDTRLRTLEEQARVTRLELQMFKATAVTLHEEVEEAKLILMPPTSEESDSLVNLAEVKEVKPPPVPSVPTLSPQVAEILERSTKGQSVRAIAQDMGIGQGEVQLILSLEQKQRR